MDGSFLIAAIAAGFILISVEDLQANVNFDDFEHLFRNTDKADAELQKPGTLAAEKLAATEGRQARAAEQRKKTL